MFSVFIFQKNEILGGFGFDGVVFLYYNGSLNVNLEIKRENYESLFLGFLNLIEIFCVYCFL